MGPLIGVTAYAEFASWGAWQDVRANLLPESYVRALTAVGAVPVLVPPASARVPPAARALVRRLDGLVLAGGADLSPSLYGAAQEPATIGTRPDRDAAEVALLTAALEADLPVLGICRGMELMVALSGGSLHQHLPDVVGHHDHRPAPGAYGSHAVALERGTRTHALLGAEVTVASYHHQGIASTGSLLVSGRCVVDGTVEAVEVPGARFALGVLWHPEAGTDLRLFEALVSEASRTEPGAPPSPIPRGPDGT